MIPAVIKGNKDVGGYEVRLPSVVEPKGEIKVVVEMAVANVITPYPKEITQVWVFVRTFTILYSVYLLALFLLLV